MSRDQNIQRSRANSRGVWSRRDFLRKSALAALALTKIDARVAWTATGGLSAPFLAFDREVETFMRARNIPGGALAVVKDRRLVYARGYGWASRSNSIPGTRYAYSNFGYCVRGRVIEKVTGVNYEKFVRDNVLARVGIRRMRIGASLEDKRAKDEVRYYMAHEEAGQSVFDGLAPARPPSEARAGRNTRSSALAPPGSGAGQPTSGMEKS